MYFSKRLISNGAKFLTTGLILFLLIKTVNFDFERFKTTLFTLRIKWLLLSLSGVIMVLAFKSYRWHILLQQTGITFSRWNSLKSYFSSYAFGVVTPGRLGEFIKIYNVRQFTGAGLMPSLKSAITDRLFDLIFLLIVALSGTIKFLMHKEINNALIILLSLIIVFILLVLMKILIVKILSLKKRKPIKYFDFVIECLNLLMGKKSIYPWLMTAISYSLFFITTWFLFLSLNITVSIIDTGYVISLVSLVLLLPISVAGFGTRELSLVYLLSLYGVDTVSALTFSLLQFLTFFLWGGLVGLIFWITNPIPLEALRNDSKKALGLLKGKSE